MFVKYTRNSNPTDPTAGITGLEGPNIALGGEGEVTEKEYMLLVERGVMLEPVDLDSQKVDELEQRAEALGIDPAGKKKDDLLKAIKDRDKTTATT